MTSGHLPAQIIGGAFYGLAALLAVAGIAKLARPAVTASTMRAGGLPGSETLARLLGTIEIVVGAVALAFGGPVSAAVVGLFYLGFARFAYLLLRQQDSAVPCGCFGESDAPVSRLHVAVNVGAVVVAALAAVWPPGSLLDVPSHQPWFGIPFLALTALLAWLLFIFLTALPSLLEAQRRVEQQMLEGGDGEPLAHEVAR